MRFSKIYGPPSLVLVFGLIASLAIFALALRVESRMAEVEFQALVRDRVLAIRATLDTQIEEVHSLSGLLSSIENLSREEFHGFSQTLLEGVGAVQALEWIPRVPASRRAEFESRARREGFPDFEFKELREGSMRRAGSRAEYFPVYYLEPFEGNEAALGFDLSSDPARRFALWSCVESGMPTASAPVVLVQDVSEQNGVLLFFRRPGARSASGGRPVDHSSLAASGPADRGFALRRYPARRADLSGPGPRRAAVARVRLRTPGALQGPTISTSGKPKLDGVCPSSRRL
jgi:CHASE1-domain containing sensor protein